MGVADFKERHNNYSRFAYIRINLACLCSKIVINMILLGGSLFCDVFYILFYVYTNITLQVVEMDYKEEKKRYISFCRSYK